MLTGDTVSTQHTPGPKRQGLANKTVEDVGLSFVELCH